MSHRPMAGLPLIAAVCVTLGACGGAPKVRTTFLTSVDLVEMTDRMAQSFAQDQVIGSRTSQSRPWVISIDRIHNFTNQIIPERQKWLYIGRLRGALAQSDIARSRNIIWIVPPGQWARLQEELGDEPPELRMKPTHSLTGQFDALTNTSGQGRSDTYLCSYFLFDLTTGVEVWRDKWEVKRSISGRTYD
jgi:hypothetical protein